MLIFLRIVITVLVTIALGACSSRQQLVYKDRYSNPIDQVLDGKWFGHLKVRAPYTTVTLSSRKVDKTPVSLTILIKGNTAQVFLYEGGDWLEAMPGQGKLVRQGPNAVAYATAISGDYPSGWVETWTLTMTVSEDKSLATEWTRVVNNVEAVAGQSLPTFSMAATGVLGRVPVDEG